MHGEIYIFLFFFICICVYVSVFFMIFIYFVRFYESVFMLAKIMMVNKIVALTGVFDMNLIN